MAYSIYFEENNDILYNSFRIMRNILSAIIIDKDYEAHNYKEVKLKNVPNWYESNFEIKLLKNAIIFYMKWRNSRGLIALLR